MKIGISTASLYPMRTEEALLFLCKNGVKVTEIFFNSFDELKPENVRRLKCTADGFGTEIVSVHPCGSVAEPYFLFSEYDRRTEETLRFYEQYYVTAALLGAKYVVLHGDSIHGTLSMERYCERLMLMNRSANRYGVSVTHENVNRFRASTPENIRGIRRFTNDGIKFTFDVKQCIRAGFDPSVIYDAMKGNIVNVHLSDHSSTTECMLPGNGDYDLKALLSRLENDGYKGAALIEVYRNAYDNHGELISSLKFCE